MANSVDDTLLRRSLQGAVPMWFMELSPKGEDYWLSRKGLCAQTVAEKGDVLMFGSKKVGAAGDVFNRLAEGCALLMLITKHPFEIFDLRFYPDGKIEDLRDVQEANHGPLQSEAVSAMCEGVSEAPSIDTDYGATSASETPGGDADAK